MTFILLLSGCDRVDPLAVVAQPTGQHSYHHYLVGNDSRIICVLPDGDTNCSVASADVIVTSIENVDDVQPNWAAQDKLEIRVRSGVVEQRRTASTDGSIRIVVREN
ncbi:hypothetical protein [Aurantiacibacter sp. MUD61]|uniref:hypothetical protein n=1 Tax=Aurantiacibacter sp. MUD61 TaxID=3009083 RepID=UPI0022F0710C|nr:hypothetical protein [Aurantiacibacter sp. MUD61]